MSDTNRIDVRIRGRQFTISAQEPEEYIYKTCAYVDKKIAEMNNANPRLSMDMAAVLAAINITDELFKTQDDEDNLRKQILGYDKEAVKYEQKIRELEAKIEKLKREISVKDKELSGFINR